MKATAQQLNTAQLKVILKWVAGGNEDGLPNEIRECYTDDEWVGIMEAYSVKGDIPTSSSHMYQCDECCTEFENLLPALDYWNSPEGQAHTAKRNKELFQKIIQSDFGS